MTQNYHTAIATGAAANASTFNAPLGTLDAQIVANTASAVASAATTAEVIAARGGFANLDTRLDTIVMTGSNVSTLTNGVANAEQKVVTVDSTTGFLAGSPVAYTLVGGVIETNTVGTVDSPTQLTMITNVGAGGIANDTYIMVVNLGALVSTGAVTGASTTAQPFTEGISIPGATTQYPLTISTFNGSFLGVPDPTLEIGFNIEDGDVRTVGVPAVWLAMEGMYATVGNNFCEFYVGQSDVLGNNIRPFALTWDNDDIRNYCAGQIYLSATEGFNFIDKDGGALVTVAGDGGMAVQTRFQFAGANPYIQTIADYPLAFVAYGHQVKVSNTLDGLLFGEDGDTNLYRSATTTLKTSSSLIVTGDFELDGALNHDGTTAGFYGTAPIAQAVLATGVAATVDDVITALQNLGLVKQA